jgi:hypothetical protein
VPQQFLHQEQQNMNATPFHHAMQLAQTPRAFMQQMLQQHPNTPALGVHPLHAAHAVPNQPQVVPVHKKKKKQVEIMVGFFCLVVMHRADGQ